MQSRLMRAALGLLAAVLAGCSTLVPAPAGPAPSAHEAHAAWARVLAERVNERGEVDFESLAREPADLDRFVKFVADTPLETLPSGPPRLAHMVNAYNALSMFNVVQSGIPASHAGWAKLEFFVLRRLQVGGQQMSLYRFENDVIRPYTRSIGDPRVHFALNCSARSCPVLPQRPFTAEGLNDEFERETRAFFQRPENYRIDAATQTVWLSELLNFYPEDFVPQAAPSLLAYAQRYAAETSPPGYAVRFTPYDWTIANSRRPR